MRHRGGVWAVASIVAWLGVGGIGCKGSSLSAAHGGSGGAAAVGGASGVGGSTPGAAGAGGGATGNGGAAGAIVGSGGDMAGGASGGTSGTGGNPSCGMFSGTGGISGSPVPSGGSFPFAGRWWAQLTVNGRVESFALHWDDNDLYDSGLWTTSSRYAIGFAPGAMGGYSLRSQSPDVSGCWTLFPTTGPDILQVQPCDTAPSTSTPPLGFFQRGGRVVHPIFAEAVAAAPTAVARVIGTHGGGQWVVTEFNGRLRLWKADSKTSYDLGAGLGNVATLSPDGRRVTYYRSNPGAVSSLIAYDTRTCGEVTITAAGATGLSDQSDPSAGSFSPGGRRLTFFMKPTTNAGDLATYDFDTGKTVTLASQLRLLDVLARIVFLSEDRALWTGTSNTSTSGGDSLFSYDFASGESKPLGDVVELYAIPGGARAAYRNTTGDVMLMDAETLVPRLLANNARVGHVTTDAGFQSTPDGKRLAYVDGDSVLHLFGFDGRAELTIADDASCALGGSAWFTSDGRAIVHALHGGCFEDINHASDVSRYDLATGGEQIVPLVGNGFIYAIGPLGQLVSEGPGVAPILVSWAWPTAELDIPPDTGFATENPKYAFSADGRYLVYTFRGTLMLRDIATGSTKQLGPFGVGNILVANPATAISVVSGGIGSPAATVAYLPDGSAKLLASNSMGVYTNPSSTAVAYIDDTGAVVVYRLRPDAMPEAIGNGWPLAVTDTQVIFRDVDGICATPL